MRRPPGFARRRPSGPLTRRRRSANSRQGLANSRAVEDRRAGRPRRLRHHPPADRLARPAGRVRRRAASRPNQKRRVPGARGATRSAWSCCGSSCVGFVAVALWRLEQAIWGFRYVSDDQEAAAQAGRGGGQGRGLHRARGARRARPRSAAAVAATASRRRRRACSGSPAASGSSARSGWGSSSRAVARSTRAGRRSSRTTWTCRRTSKPRKVVERSGQVGFIAKGVSIGADRRAGRDRRDPVRPRQGGRPRRRAELARADQPFGPCLLVVVALGLAAYGVFCFFDAKYHRV